ncbi:hypothetical protein ElyMa_001458600 [Elysia marginata]|uniref:Uncharacterized protein n=1 Tax=Elysia marginata TaxID=1093978 RepID=A0AAV4J332_9GAST|nr:hypothetical protein ElyMa_001458600 [Elysia marginata]
MWAVQHAGCTARRSKLPTSQALQSCQASHSQSRRMLFPQLVKLGQMSSSRATSGQAMQTLDRAASQARSCCVPVPAQVSNQLMRASFDRVLARGRSQYVSWAGAGGGVASGDCPFSWSKEEEATEIMSLNQVMVLVGGIN